MYFVIASIGNDLNGTVCIGTVNIDAGILVAFQGFRMGVVHAVEVTAGENQGIRFDGFDKC